MKLQEAFKSASKEHLIDPLMENSEKLILTCRFFGLLTNLVLVLVLIEALAAKGLENIAVNKIKPGIEDCFMDLMNIES